MPPRCRAGRAEADGIALRGAFNDSLEGGAMRPHASHGAAARPDGPAACAPDALLLRRRPDPRPVTATARGVHAFREADLPFRPCDASRTILWRHAPGNPADRAQGRPGMRSDSLVAPAAPGQCGVWGLDLFSPWPWSLPAAPRGNDPGASSRIAAAARVPASVRRQRGVAGGDGWSDGWRTLGVPCALPAPTDRFRLRPDRGVTPLPSAFVTIYGRSGPFIINRGTR